MDNRLQEQKLARDHRANNRPIIRFQNAMDALAKQVQHWKVQFETAQTRIVALVDDLATRAQTIVTLRASLHDTRRDHDRLATQVAQLRNIQRQDGQIARLLQERNQAVQERQSLEADNATLTDALNQKQQALELAEKEVKDLQVKLQQQTASATFVRDSSNSDDSAQSSRGLDSPSISARKGNSEKSHTIHRNAPPGATIARTRTHEDKDLDSKLNSGTAIRLIHGAGDIEDHDGNFTKLTDGFEDSTPRDSNRKHPHSETQDTAKASTKNSDKKEDKEEDKQQDKKHDKDAEDSNHSARNKRTKLS